jgi:hypothetical protein
MLPAPNPTKIMITNGKYDFHLDMRLSFVSGRENRAFSTAAAQLDGWAWVYLGGIFL